MLTRILAAAAFATMTAAAAHAGTIQNGTWTPSSACKDAGDPPVISDKSPDAYNKSTKELPTWQANAQAFATCVQGEAKTDQNAVVTGANAVVGKLNDQLNSLKATSDAAIAKLKGGKK